MKDTFTNSLWVVVRYGIIFATGFGLSLFFARSGNLILYGQYQYLLSLVGLFSVAALPGLNLAAIKSVVSNSPGNVIRTVYLSFFGGLIGALFLLGWTFIYTTTGVLRQSLIIACGFFPLYYAANTWYAYYEGKLLLKEESIRVIIANLITALVLISAVLIRQNLTTMISVFFGMGIIFAVGYTVEGVYKFGRDIREKLDISLGLKVTVQKFSLSLLDNLPVILITHIFAYSAVAVYQVAMLWLNSILGVISALSVTYLSKLLKQDSKTNKKKELGIQLLISFCLWMGLLGISQIVFVPIYGDRFKAGLDILTWLSPLVIIYPIKTFLVNQLTARGDVIIPTLAQIIVILIAVPIIFFGKEYGLLATIVTFQFIANILFIGFLSIRNGVFKNSLNFSP